MVTCHAHHQRPEAAVAMPVRIWTLSMAATAVTTTVTTTMASNTSTTLRPATTGAFFFGRVYSFDGGFSNHVVSCSSRLEQLEHVISTAVMHGKCVPLTKHVMIATMYPICVTDTRRMRSVTQRNCFLGAVLLVLCVMEHMW